MQDLPKFANGAIYTVCFGRTDLSDPPSQPSTTGK